ncbi:MAG: hypothetical protein OXF27_08220 [Acidobacteria bacterium]|nr:hypothetical protein [Acidobacteriota bacterium]
MTTDCRTCWHFAGNRAEGSSTPGECRVNPPLLWGQVERDMPGGGDPCLARWPMVSPSEGCGAHEPVPAPAAVSITGPNAGAHRFAAAMVEAIGRGWHDQLGLDIAWDARGVACLPDEPQAVRFCLAGALHYARTCAGRNGEGVFLRAMDEAMRQHWAGEVADMPDEWHQNDPLSAWEAAPHRSHDDVISLVGYAADKLADQHEACSCQNCRWHGTASETKTVEGLMERIGLAYEHDHGFALLPVGECPECGALAYDDAHADAYDRACTFLEQQEAAAAS